MKIGLYYNNGGTWTLVSNGCNTKANPGTGWQDVTLTTPYVVLAGQELLALAAVNDDVYAAYNSSYEGHYTESGNGYNGMCSSTDSYSAEAASGFGARVYVD